MKETYTCKDCGDSCNEGNHPDGYRSLLWGEDEDDDLTKIMFRITCPLCERSTNLINFIDQYENGDRWVVPYWSDKTICHSCAHGLMPDTHKQITN